MDSTSNYKSPLEQIEYLTFALNAAGVGTWHLDPVSGSITWDQKCRELYGLPELPVISYSDVFNHVHPEDTGKVNTAVNDALSGRDGGKYDIRFRTSGITDGVIRWLHCKGKAYFDASGKAYRFSGVAQDITEQVQEKEERIASDEIAKMAMENSNSGYFSIDLETDQIEYSQGLARVLTGDEKHTVKHADFVKHIHPDDLHIRSKAFQKAAETGKLQYEARVIWGDGSIHWIRANGSYINDTAGKPYLFMGTVYDTTAEHLHRVAVKDAEELLSSAFNYASMGIAFTELNGHFLRINASFSALLGYTEEELTDLSYEDIIYAADREKNQSLFNELLGGKRNFYNLNKRFIHKDGSARWALVNITRITGTNSEEGRILVMARDITHEIAVQEALQESELFSRTIVDNSPVAKVVFTGEDQVIRIINKNMLEMLGRDASIIGKTFREAMPEISAEIGGRMKEVYRTGETYIQPEEKISFLHYGQPHTGYYNYIYKALRNTAGQIYGVITTATDVTQQVLTRQKIEEAESNLRGAIELADLGTWQLDLNTMLLDYSERLREWFGIGAEEEITITRAEQAIRKEDRGRIREAICFAIKPGNAGAFDLEYSLEGTDDINARILHAQGKTFYDETGKAYKISGTVQDVTIQRMQQLALENEVQERTEELAAANEELQALNEELALANEDLAVSNVHLTTSNQELAQYAYVASHDLQEPLRKIRMFSSLLSDETSLQPEGARLVRKITESSTRMSMLIQSLLDYSRLLKSDELWQPVDLAELIQQVKLDFELAIEEKNAAIIVGELPVVTGISLQLNQLFYNLIGNALKFVKPGVAPLVTVSSKTMTNMDILREMGKSLPAPAYHKISISDNGIGFDKKFADQVFEVFKRLHGRDVYPGSGIGLALCKRIVENHHGHIKAVSQEGAGTEFHILLPA